MINRLCSTLAFLTLALTMIACNKEPIGDSSSGSSSSSSGTLSSSSGAPYPKLDCESDACNLFINAIDKEQAVFLSYIHHPDETGDYHYSGAEDNHVQWRTVDTHDPDHELAIEFAFNANDPFDEISDSGWFGLAASTENDRVDLSAFKNGALSFDMRVMQKGERDGILDVKMECDYPCTSWELWLDEPEELEQWQTYDFPIQRFIETGLDITAVNNLMILKPGWANQRGAYIFQIDNIVLRKSWSPAMTVEPPKPTEDLSLPLYTDVLADGVIYGTGDPDNLLITEQATGDTNYLDLNFLGDSNASHAYFYWDPWEYKDLNDYYHADLVFDIRVVDYANNTGEFVLNVLCGWPCRATPDYPIGRPAEGEWQEVRVPLKTLALKGLHLERVTNPFLINFSEIERTGLNYQLKDVHWEFKVED